MLNPIDMVEDMINDHWVTERPTAEVLCVHIDGQWGAHRLHFVWDYHKNAMHMSSVMDICIPTDHIHEANALLGLINRHLWLGNFQLADFPHTPFPYATRLPMTAPTRTDTSPEPAPHRSKQDTEQEVTPLFRCTLPGAETPMPTPEQIEIMMTTALQESERFYPAFQYILLGAKNAEEALSLALIHTVGKA